MPNSVFDLGGELTVDASQVKSLPDEVKSEMDKVSGLEATATMTLDDGEAKARTKALASDFKTLGREIEKKHSLNIDTSDAQAELKSWRDTLRDEIMGGATRDLEAFESRLKDVSQSGPTGLSAFTTGRTGMMVGGGIAAAGVAGAGLIAGSAIKSAYAEDLMLKSTEQVFGKAAEAYQAQAEEMADATGFMTKEILAAQLAMNKVVKLTSGEVTRGEQTFQVGLKSEQIQPLVARAADIADTTGLPQYANNLQAVSAAIASALEGSTGALLDFGISLDDLYVLSLPANRAFKELGETITPAEMAQARYNAIMEQTATIAGKAADHQDDITASLRQFTQKMEGAKEAVGETLIPIANFVADFISSIPKEMLTAGVWAALGLSIATALGGAVIGIRALIVGARDLGAAAAVAAAQTKAAAVGIGTSSAAATGSKGLGRVEDGLGSLASKAAMTATVLAASIPIITGVWDMTAEALKGPKAQASMSEIQAMVGQRRNLAQKGGEWMPMTGQERAELAQLYASPHKGELSAETVNSIIDMAEAQAVLVLQRSGQITDSAAQAHALEIQTGADSRAYQRTTRENPQVAADQTIQIILDNRSDADLQLDAGAYERTVR